MTEIRIQPPSATLTPGQSYRVPILLRVDEPLKVRGVHATFHGAEETTATYTTYNAATKATETHTAIEHFDIVKEMFLLSGQERKGFWGNFADGFATLLGGGEHDVLDPGEYSFEVEIQAPADARPSFAGEVCRVFYELTVDLDIPAARDVKATQSFQIAEETPEETESTSVRTRYPEDQGLGFWDAWLIPELRAEVALAQQTLKQGDTAEGMFKVESPKPLNYRSIKVRLISVENVTAHGHASGHIHQGEPLELATGGVIDSEYVQRFQLPVSLPGPRQVQGTNFKIECFLQIELDVPWAKDPAIRVPVNLV